MVALLTLHVGLTRVAMSSAGAAIQVHKNSLDDKIIRYLQGFDDLRTQVVIECFQDKNAWKQVLSAEDKKKYLGHWASQLILVGERPDLQPTPKMLQEDFEFATTYQKIDVALHFLQEIKKEGTNNVDEVIEALFDIKTRGGRRDQVPEPISLGPAHEAPENTHYVAGRFDATTDLGQLGDGPDENNHVALRNTSSRMFKAPDTVTTSEDEESDTDDDNARQPRQSGIFKADFFLRDKQLQLRFW